MADDGEWRIARRVCAFEWRRTDPVGDGSSFVWHILDETRRS